MKGQPVDWVCVRVHSLALHHAARLMARVSVAADHAPVAEHTDSVRASIDVIKKEETVVHIDLSAKVPVRWLVCEHACPCAFVCGLCRP